MHATDSRQLAHWHFQMDPAARRILFVSPPPSSSEDAATALIFEPNLLVVVREGPEPPRIVRREQFVMPHVLWEVSPAVLDAVRSGAAPSPPGFDADRWEEVPRQGDDEPARVTRLMLRSFRSFDAKELSFEPGFNVLIGRNGSGKTAVLDALAEIIRHAVRALSGQESVTLLSPEDVRVLEFQRGEVQVEEPQYPAEIDAGLAMFGDELGTEHGWQVSSGHGGAWSGTGRPVSFVNILDFARLSVQSGYDVSLPVFAYYRTGRMWAGTAETNGARHDERSRLAGYAGWDQPAVDMRPLEQWFNRMELLGAQRGVSSAMLDAIKSTILRCLGTGEYEAVRYDAAHWGLAVKAKRIGAPWLPFRRLSDGVRNILGMVADLAVRCARLNPHFGAAAPEKTSGVVLIDELDLHLHPTWQRRVVDDLRSAFPRVQFITTTHSPAILQSLQHGNLIGLDGEPQGDPADKSYEDILEIFMNVEQPQRSRRWHAMVDAAREYQRALEGAERKSPEEKAALKGKLDVLLEPYRENPAFVAFLQLKRAASKLDDSVDVP